MRYTVDNLVRKASEEHARKQRVARIREYRNLLEMLKNGVSAHLSGRITLRDRFVYELMQKTKLYDCLVKRGFEVKFSCRRIEIIIAWMR